MLRLQKDRQALSLEVDRSDMAGVISEFPAQIRAARDDPDFPEIPGGRFERVAVVGMGGSSLFVEMLSAAFQDTLSVPLIACRSYGLSLPRDPSTLVVASSFSGETEETIAALEAAADAGASIVVLTGGGKLEEIARTRSYPLIKFRPQRAQLQPRCAIGYMATYLARLLAAAGIGERPLEEMARLPDFLDALDLRAEAEDLAFWLEDSIPVIYTDECHERSIARPMKIKFNENAKRPAFFNSLPELNHNEMIGFEGPLGRFALIYLKDPASDPRLHGRFQAMGQTFGDAGLRHVRFREWTLVGESALEKIFAANCFADWASYTTALIDGVDPTPVQLVQDFKATLAAGRGES